MNSQEKNNTDFSHSFGNSLAIILVVCGLWHKYRFVIGHYQMEFSERLENPFFIMAMILSVVMFIYMIYRAGYHCEIIYNNIKKCQYGIVDDDQEQNMTFPFKSFDLKEAL